MHVKSWLRTVPTLVIIGTVLFLVLSVGSGLLLLGLRIRARHGAQPAVGAEDHVPGRRARAALDPKQFPGLQRYAGQAVDNGAKAKAYADQFIARAPQGDRRTARPTRR